MLNIMNNDFYKECLNILKDKEINDSILEIIQPLLNMIFRDIYPYIFISVLFVVVSFLLNLGMFILLMRNKGNLSKVI
jgi:hypothetical protein